MGQDKELGQHWKVQQDAARSEKVETWAKGKCDRAVVCTYEHLWGQLG